MRILACLPFIFVTLAHSQDRGSSPPRVIKVGEGEDTVRKIEDLMPDGHEFVRSLERHDEYRKHSTVIYPKVWAAPVPGHEAEFEEKEFAQIELVLWDPVSKKFPGRNYPIVEVFRDEKLERVIVLEDVHWMTDLWAATHQGVEYLYVKGRWRFRKASPTYIYQVGRRPVDLVMKSVFFEKAELKEERKGEGGQAGTRLQGTDSPGAVVLE